MILGGTYVLSPPPEGAGGGRFWYVFNVAPSDLKISLYLSPSGGGRGRRFESVLKIAPSILQVSLLYLPICRKSKAALSPPPEGQGEDGSDHFLLYQI